MPDQEIVVAPKKELAKPEPQSGKLSRIAAFTPVNLTEAIALSKLIAGSDLAPRDFKGKPANVLIAMQMGAEVGLAPMQSLQNIAVINGRPSLWGDAALGVVQVHPEYEWHKEWWEGTGDARKALFQIKRKGQEAHQQTFSVQDAKTAQLWTKPGPWKTNPDRMLQLRARGFGLRDKFADALRGLSIAEEVMDISPDSSDVKRKREEATLDVSTSLSSLAPSSEPNRGHNDTGLGRRDEQAQAPAKSEPVMCSKCGKIDSHEADCPDAKQDAKTSKPTTKALYLILSAATKKAKAGNEYLLLDAVTVTTEGDKHGKLYVWHKSLHPYLAGLSDKKIVVEVSEENKDGKTFVEVQHILEIEGVPFVNDVPAQQGEMPAKEEF